MDNCMLFFHQPILIFINSWLSCWVHWRCKLKFLLGCLCPLMAWRRFLLCLLAIRQLSWWSRKELHWNLHESFISNGLGVSFVCSWSFTALWDTVGRPLIENVRHDVVASRHLGPYCRRASLSFEDDESRCTRANTRWVAPFFSLAS